MARVLGQLNGANRRTSVHFCHTFATAFVLVGGSLCRDKPVHGNVPALLRERGRSPAPLIFQGGVDPGIQEFLDRAAPTGGYRFVQESRSSPTAMLLAKLPDRCLAALSLAYRTAGE